MSGGGGSFLLPRDLTDPSKKGALQHRRAIAAGAGKSGAAAQHKRGTSAGAGKSAHVDQWRKSVSQQWGGHVGRSTWDQCQAASSQDDPDKPALRIEHKPRECFGAENMLYRNVGALSLRTIEMASAGYVWVPGTGFWYVHSDGQAAPVNPGMRCACGYWHHT